MGLFLSKAASLSPQDLDKETTPHGQFYMITKEVMAVCCNECGGAFPILVQVMLSEN